MNSKHTVLVFIDWFSPGYRAGGPIRSVTNLIDHLSGEVQFKVVTRNTDFGLKIPYEGIETNKWLKFDDNTEVLYLGSEQVSRSSIKAILESTHYDVLYFNSFFSFWFTFIPLLKAKPLKKKIILAPRGMLAANALALKASKKKIYISLFKRLKLHKKVTWHASTDLEKAEIEAVFGRDVTVSVARNFSKKIVKSEYSRSKKRNELNLFFISRIAKKKNLLFALNVLKDLGNQHEVKFDIFGPIDEGEYWEACKKVISTLPLNVKVNYKGVIPNEKLDQELREYHFMLLPTLNENFGHVVVESFSLGIPVILSTETPWRNLENLGVGWDLSLDKAEDYITVLEKCYVMSSDDYRSMSEKAFDYAQTVVTDPKVMQANLHLFLKE